MVDKTCGFKTSATGSAVSSVDKTELLFNSFVEQEDGMVQRDGSLGDMLKWLVRDSETLEELRQTLEKVLRPAETSVAGVGKSSGRMLSGSDTFDSSDLYFCKEGKRMDETVPIYLLGIQEREQIDIKRNVESQYCAYVCGECGIETKLRNSDMVVCKHCFGRIFYKKNHRQVSIYDCR